MKQDRNKGISSAVKQDRRNEENGSNFVTPGGLLLLVALFLLSAWLHRPELSMVSLAAFVFFLISLLWGKYSLEGLDLSFRGESCRVFPGEELRFSVEVENRKWLPLFWMTLLFPEDKSGAFPNEPGYFNWILPWQSLQWEQCWKTEKRGVYALDRAELVSGDGFGLAVQSRMIRPERGMLFVVYPKLLSVITDPLPFNAADLGRGKDGLLEDVSLLKGTREYQPGDSARRINWRMLAMQGRMEVNLYEQLRPKAVPFLVDLASFGDHRALEGRDGKSYYYVDRYHEQELEEMISLAASLIVRFAEKQCRPALVLPKVLPAEVEGDTVTMKRSGSGGGLLRPASPEEAVPELLMQLSAILYYGGPAVFPAEETLRASHALGQIFVLTMSPERLTCRKLLDRLPENRLCLIAHGAAEAHPVYRVVERRALLA